MDEPI